MTIRVGFKSTKILLTEVGKNWFTESYPKGIVYEYDEDKPFDLRSMGADFIEVLCPLSIPYRIPLYVGGEITFNVADKEADG